jgi:hypothetical protein
MATHAKPKLQLIVAFIQTLLAAQTNVDLISVSEGALSALMISCDEPCGPGLIIEYYLIPHSEGVCNYLSDSEGARAAPNNSHRLIVNSHQLIVMCSKISFHFCKGCRIFCEGEYQVKNNGYAINDFGKKQQQSIILNDNSNDECQQEKNDGKVIINAEAVKLTIVGLLGIGGLSLIGYIGLDGLNGFNNISGISLISLTGLGFISLVGHIGLIGLVDFVDLGIISFGLIALSASAVLLAHGPRDFCSSHSSSWSHRLHQPQQLQRRQRPHQPSRPR